LEVDVLYSPWSSKFFDKYGIFWLDLASNVSFYLNISAYSAMGNGSQ